jgi:hypothetical protein
MALRLRKEREMERIMEGSGGDIDGDDDDDDEDGFMDAVMNEWFGGNRSPKAPKGEGKDNGRKRP